MKWLAPVSSLQTKSLVAAQLVTIHSTPPAAAPPRHTRNHVIPREREREWLPGKLLFQNFHQIQEVAILTLKKLWPLWKQLDVLEHPVDL